MFVSSVTQSGKIKAASEQQKEISMLVAMISEVSNKSHEKPSPQYPGALYHLAIKHVVPKLSPDNNLWALNMNAVLSEINAPNLLSHIVNDFREEIIGQLKFSNNPSVVFDIAAEQIKIGKSCRDVAEWYEIPLLGNPFDELQMIAVNGPAGKRVMNGESCRIVADEHGVFLNSNAGSELQMIAVNGPAGERIRSGESWKDVADKHGISYRSQAFNTLLSIFYEHSTPSE